MDECPIRTTSLARRRGTQVFVAPRPASLETFRMTKDRSESTVNVGFGGRGAATSDDDRDKTTGTEYVSSERGERAAGMLNGPTYRAGTVPGLKTV